MPLPTPPRPCTWKPGPLGSSCLDLLSPTAARPSLASTTHLSHALSLPAPKSYFPPLPTLSGMERFAE